MHKKTLYIALVAFLVINAVDARKTTRGKRPKEDEDSTPQPNVVTYSTFGFNDVNSYDGFVPSSPDYSSYLSTYNKESSTRLYAPAFPTALDTEYNNGYESQPQDTLNFRLGDGNNAPQASMLQYPHNPMNFFNTPSLESEPKSEQGTPDDVYGRSTGEDKASGPIYGAKLSSKNRNKFFNSTEFNGYREVASNPNSDKYFQIQSTYEHKPASYGEQSKNYQNSYNNNYQAYSPIKNEESINQESTQPVSYNKFPKVVDFTKFKQYYPTELDTKNIMPGYSKPNTVEYETNNQNENKYSSNFDSYNSRYTTVSTPPFKSPFNNKAQGDETDKEVSTLPAFTDTNYSNNYFGYNDNKDESKVPKNPLEFKDKFKYKSWPSVNSTNDYRNWKNPVKGYQYSTNVSSMNFEFDFTDSKPSMKHQLSSVNNTDEYVPASSNNIDYSTYQFPDPEYSNSPYSSFKKIPSFKGQNDEYSNIASQLKYQEYNYDPVDYVKSLYSTAPTTTTSSWGNVFKNSEYSYSKYHPKRPVYGEDAKDEVVHIGTKRPYSSSKYNFGKYTDNKQAEWPFNSRPQKPRNPYKHLDGEISGTKYKSEEDLLGLRTHDTSHPSYLPTSYRASNSLSEDYDYKKLVEKWRQSYLRSKYKDTFKESPAYDYESYPSETKPVHVPIPKPYPIEIPHPVIVPVPQPYPVRVPIPKPVAVPVMQEISVPVEKPVPYPVIKKVPYPVEKLVPVMVEKEVKVPVMKPYPVHVPQIRPVFHHTRPQDDMDAAIDIDDEYDYMPRPESTKKTQYAKRPRGSRNRTPRRPTRVRPIFPERNRRRWPTKSSDNRRKPVSSPEREHSRYPRRPAYPRDHQITRYPPSKPQEFDAEDFDSESDYLAYVHCKRTGNC